MRYLRLLIILLLCFAFLNAKITMNSLYESIIAQFPEDKVYTITDFSGNYAKDFSQNLRATLLRKNILYVDYDIHQKVLQETLKYSEPVFDDKYQQNMPSLITPEILISGNASLQKSNFLFKQKEHLDFQVTLIEMDTGLILRTTNDRVQFRYNPPILLLIIVIVLILAVARWVIYLKKGYNVRHIIVGAMLVVTVIVVWWML